MSITSSWEGAVTVAPLATTIIIAVTLAVFYYQLGAMKKGTTAQAFATVASILDDEKVRMARRTLMKNSKDYTAWEPKEIDDAETACTNYSTVGIMVQHKMIDKKMVIQEWRNSIKKSYENAKPMIEAYRREEVMIFGVILNCCIKRQSKRQTD